MRSRLRYVALGIAVVAAGLAVHSLPLGLPRDARDIVGDALWAMMMWAWVSAMLPTRSPTFRATISLAICWTVEFTQLIHTPGIDAVRETLPGQLILGSGFDVRDLFAYAAGIAVAALLGRLLE